MILRRLSRSARRQDWFAVALELVVEVLGIFLGLQVSTWNEARQDREREADAEQFARKWSEPVERAYHKSRGESWRVSIRRGRPPWYGSEIKSGAVVLCRSDRRAYAYHPMNRGQSWT